MTKPRNSKTLTDHPGVEVILEAIDSVKDKASELFGEQKDIILESIRLAVGKIVRKASKGKSVDVKKVVRRVMREAEDAMTGSKPPKRVVKVAVKRAASKAVKPATKKPARKSPTKKAASRKK